MAPKRPSAPPRVPAGTARPSTPDLHPGYKIDPVPHMPFARMCARVVRAKAGFPAGSHEERELEGVALLTLCRQAIRFDARRVRPGTDPGRLFQGWSKQNILKECKRAAAKLRRAGLWQAPDKLPRVRSLPRSRCSNCADVTLAAQVGGDYEVGEPIACDTTLSRDFRRALPADAVEPDEVLVVVVGVEPERAEQAEALAEALAVAARQE